MIAGHAQLRFDMSDPDESRAHMLCIRALDLAMALHELDEWLRDAIKYSEATPLQPARDRLHQILEERGIDLDGLL